MARVLVVDDNDDLRELIGVYVIGAGHAVAYASSGQEALELVTQRGAPDLAVLDVMMPGMTGLELLARLRELPGLEELPAIFLSARVTPEDIACGIELGAAYLTKPFVGSALLATMRRVLPPTPTGW